MKRSETESGMQLRSIRDQNDPSIGSKLEPFMKQIRNVAKPNLERNHAYATKMIRVSAQNLSHS